MTDTIRVIGIGSPVVGDHIGMQLVERLRQEPQWQGRDDIEWLVLERPGAVLLHYFDGAGTVCLIDALAAGNGSGVVRINPDELLLVEEAISTHHFGVAEAIRLAAGLGQLPSRLLLYGVAGGAERYDELQRMLVADLTP